MYVHVHVIVHFFPCRMFCISDHTFRRWGKSSRRSKCWTSSSQTDLAVPLVFICMWHTVRCIIDCWHNSKGSGSAALVIGLRSVPFRSAPFSVLAASFELFLAFYPIRLVCAMSTRKPLVPWNRDPGKGTGKATKRERYRFALLSRASLVEQLNMILRQVDVSGPPITLSEEDLASPSVRRAGGRWGGCS